jgi:ABC-type transporter MlaC component
MRLSPILTSSALVAALAVALPAHAAADAQGFIEHEHQKLTQMLRQPPSAARDAEVNNALGGFVDYANLIPRSFGEPCHPSLPNCEDLWARWDASQKAQLSTLLQKVIEKAYRNNLQRTLDYDVSYKGSKDAGGDTRVITEAKSKTNPRDTPTRIDYVVKDEGGKFRVVDIVTEGSSFSKNLYVQFRKLDDYDKIVGKLNDKLAEKSTTTAK